ncbi:MAG: low molecular weight phosphotyrosine protein phosphatase [Clostridiales bacterium]|nr:low molecular weight phosphotyrosine protein phosphatase [Candidatus Equinaster intestinalis]
MYNIVFVCLGNICRSPMAEFIFLDMLKKEELQDKIAVSSAGTSSEEQGNGLHYGAQNELKKNGIPYSYHVAHKITDEEYKNADMVIVMESRNRDSLVRRFGQDGKTFLLLDFCGGGNIADPWYTGNFSDSYNDILKGLNALLKYLKEEILRML